MISALRPQITRPQTIILGLLGLLMAATRYHHFGTALHLPDASLAVFFAAGFYLPQRKLLPLLLAEAALIDWVAITIGGTSDWCVSPAYVFLIPTYASLWFGGRWYANRHCLSWSSAIPLVLVLTLAASAAFLISNGSFYLLSGRFPDLSWVQYGERVARYYGSYVGNAYAYVSFLAFMHVVVTSVARSSGVRNER